MTDLLLTLCGLFVLAAAVWFVVRPVALFDYPVFMTVMFAGVFAPQVWQIYEANASYLPGGAFEQYLSVLLLCLAAAWAGYVLPVPRARWLGRVRLHAGRLEAAGWALTAVGTAATVVLMGMTTEDVEKDAQGQSTGIFTVLVMVTNVQFPAAAVLLYLACRRLTPSRGLGVVAATWPIVYAALALGRREPAFALGVIVLAILYWARRVRPPRLLVLGGVALAAMYIQVIGSYRGLAAEQGMAAAVQFDVANEFLQRRDDRTAAAEVNMAALYLAYMADRPVNLGAGYWNNIVFRFVPAQFVGAGVKGALYLPVHPPMFPRFADHPPFAPPGTTVTGPADSFAEFGYAGCLFFLVSSWLFHMLRAECDRGGAAPVLVLASTMTLAMKAGTHQTIDFPPAALFVLLVLGPAFRFSRLRPGEPAAGGL